MKPGNLVNHRRAQVIDIEAADSFFHAIQQSVESIQQFSRPHPLSTEAAVASLKRYLSEPRYRIQLADLVRETVERVVEHTSSEAFDKNSPDPNTETVSTRVRAYEEACSTLLAMAVVGGRWGENDHIEVWQQALERLATVSLASGKSMWPGLRLYPATVLLYALGLGALSAEAASLPRPHLFDDGFSARQRAGHACRATTAACSLVFRRWTSNADLRGYGRTSRTTKRLDARSLAGAHDKHLS